MALPPTMSIEILDALSSRIEEHISTYQIKSFVCSFHGGEPMLFGFRRMQALLLELRGIGERQRCAMQFAFTTNGVLINSDWVGLFREFNVSVAVSIDGPPEIHDARRVTVKGRPSWRDAVSGYFELCKGGLSPAILAVCEPTADPGAIIDHFSGDLGATFCDILVPDANNDDHVTSIAAFYVGLFDHWYDRSMAGKFEIRILTEMARGLLGLETKVDTIGFGPTQTVCVSTDGQIEAHDVLRIAGQIRARTDCNIQSHRLDAVFSDPLWCAVRDQSTSLSPKCRSCRYKIACGGGQLAQRWSSTQGYDNPSVYCSDYILILDHIARKMQRELEASGLASCFDDIEIPGSLRPRGSLGLEMR